MEAGTSAPPPASAAAAAPRFATVGVVGAGVMGVGVAQNLAQTGHDVVLADVGEEQLERARSEIRSAVRMQGLFAKKGASADEVLGRIETTTDLGRLADADFVIENVVEKWPVKEPVYRRLDAVCRPEVVFAANTSAISITRIGGATGRPDRVVGMHFMNPVPLKPVVEVIRGHHTSEETLAAARDLLADMGKEGIVVNDMPGFVSNRVLMLTINEAIFLVQDQVAEAADVDRIFKTCFGHKMGPLETGDLIGLDTILFSLEVLYESYNDDKYRPSPLLKKMVHAGLHGRKSGRGFYDYGIET
ncbi:MAG TPA: 3-hydroxyacyl-CoA dehydrogenase NAD-binding domain-containing protein [Thermoanaerobaculia bacterium]|nr:3-hydroxyacyl-CoA dehydrogenase NAD-binding domain-containing protein [Thermoanaerobaculia bacterium]